MNAKERIEEILNYYELSANAFADRIQIGRAQAIYDILSGKTKSITEKMASKIISAFSDISKSWLMSGEGEMLKTAQPVIKDYSTVGAVPYYAVDFIAGFDLVANNQTRNPDGYVSFPNIRGAQYWVDISGKSMSPLIDPGDVIAIKKVEDWPTNILWGEVYALVTEQYRTVKRVRRSDQEGYIRLVPENPDYDPQDIPAASVVAIYQVLGCAKKFF